MWTGCCDNRCIAGDGAVEVKVTTRGSARGEAATVLLVMALRCLYRTVPLLRRSRNCRCSVVRMQYRFKQHLRVDSRYLPTKRRTKNVITDVLLVTVGGYPVKHQT
jgi:hypothetical protein